MPQNDDPQNKDFDFLDEDQPLKEYPYDPSEHEHDPESIPDEDRGDQHKQFESASRGSAAIPLGHSASKGFSTLPVLSSGNSYEAIPVTNIKKLDIEPVANGILQICSQLYFRQSLLKDYLSCPQMALYKWIIGHEEEDTFFAALLGTGGHSVIELMHQEKNVKNFGYTTIEMNTLFVEFCNKALQSSSVPPRISAKFNSIAAQMNAAAPEYAQMLQGYANDKRNHAFHATVNEQLFTLVLESTDPHCPGIYIFTGTIDQAGFYADGSFALRDIKFRAQNFRPGYTQLQLDLQLSIYAYALRYGFPACDSCKPRYGEEGELVYTGPCEECNKKIGTAAWPQLVAERTELIWMRDYVPRKKDEFAKMITSETEKEINPATGRLRKKQMINEKWVSGYKQGDQTGPAILTTVRSPTFLNVRMMDVIQICHSLRSGKFYRKESDNCNFWCKFRKPCTQMLETQIDELDASTLNERIATLDPFGDS